MDLIIYHNGNLKKPSEAPVSVYDHGFLFGDGVRVNLRAYNKKPFMLSEHYKDFAYSIEQLDLKVSLTEKSIEKIIKILLDQNLLSDAIISLVVSRGEGYFNFNANLNIYPNVIIMTSPVLNIDETTRYQGVKLFVSSKYRIAPTFVKDHQIFTLSSQSEILSIQEALKNRAFESVMVNMEGYVCEGARSNVFIIKEDKLLTPDIECGLKNHVMRRVIMKLARTLGITVIEKLITVNDLFNSDACFIASTELEILPVKQINEKAIGDGRVNKTVGKISAALKKLTDGELLDLI
ncbi:MAG: hypothetical protein ACD_79C00147G0004 [uncultured bacterium]|nr:MAG: hypothetical protein ACD_79C00147G0004 [uncultured bacterium]